MSKEMIELLKNMDFDSDGFITPEEFHASVILEGASADDPIVGDMMEILGSFADDDLKHNLLDSDETRAWKRLILANRIEKLWFWQSQTKFVDQIS